jgi:hypothetical protein
MSFVPPPATCDAGGIEAPALPFAAAVPQVPQNLWFCSSAAPQVEQDAMGAA